MIAMLQSKRARNQFKQLIVRPGYGSRELHLGQDEKQVRELLSEPESVRRYAPEGQYFYNYPGVGIELDFGKKGGCVKYVYFFRKGVQNHRQANVVTTDGLGLADRRSKVLKLLGKPDKTGGGTYYGEWMTYNKGITLEFGVDHRIDMITIHRPKVSRKRGRGNEPRNRSG